MSSPFFQFGVEFLDAQGVRTSIPLYLAASGESLDAALAQAGHVASDLDLLTDAQIVSATAHIPIALTGIKGAPVAGSDLSVGALVTLQGSLGFQGSIWIPAWIKSNFAGDVANIPVAWEIAGTSTYWTAGGNPPWQTDRYDNAYNNSLSARKSFHALRRNIRSVKS